MSAPQLTQFVQGQGSVSADMLNGFEQTCDYALQLRSFIGTTGNQVFARGLSAPNDGYAAPYYWDSTSSASDDGISVIAPNGAGATGRWIRILLSASVVGFLSEVFGALPETVNDRLQGEVYVSDFIPEGQQAGLRAGTSGYDCTAAANLAIAAATALGGNLDIVFPRGKYPISGSLNPITVPGVGFRGLGNNGSIISASTNGPLFTWGNGTTVVNGGGLDNIQVIYPSSPGSLAVLSYQNGASGQSFTNLRVSNIRTFLQAGSTTGSIGNSATISGLNGNVFNGGSPCFNLYAGAGLFLSNVEMFVAGVPTPANNRTSTMTVVSGTNLIQTNGFTFDTVIIGSGCIFERWWRVGNFVTSGASIVLLNVIVNQDCVCDFISDDCWHLESQAGSGGIVDVDIGGYCNSWSGRTVHVLANSNARFVDLTRIYSAFSGYETILFEGSNGAVYFSIDRARALSPNRLNTGVNGVRVTTGSHFTITDGQLGVNDAQDGSNWNGPFGLSIAADLDYFVITGNYAEGTTNPYDIPYNTTQATDRVVRNNITANYAGWQPNSGNYTFPASGFAYTYLGSTTMEVSITGVTLTSVTKNGHAVNSTFTIQPGDAFIPTYTGTMTNDWANILS